MIPAISVNTKTDIISFFNIEVPIEPTIIRNLYRIDYYNIFVLFAFVS